MPKSKRLPFTLGLVRNTALGAFLVNRMNAFAVGATYMGITRKRLSRPIRKAYCAPYDTAANRIATLRFVQDIPLSPADPSWNVLEDTAAKLDQFKSTPALICWGAKDFVFDDHFLKEWQQRWPHAQTHRFADCGHYVLEDAPDEIIAHVKTFFEANPLQQETC